MNNKKYTESDLENATLEWLEEIGYSVAFGPNLAPDGETPERKTYQDVVLVDRLRAAIARINPKIPKVAQDDAVEKIVALPWSKPTLIEVNQAFHKMLTDGVDVAYKDEHDFLKGDKVYVVDQKNLTNNDWLAVNQFTVIENNHNRRPDVVVFINGLPVAVFELKNPADAAATNRHAFNQIQTYKTDIPSLFAYNELCILADQIKSGLVGTISSDMDRFMAWKSIDGKTTAKTDDVEVLIKGMFAPERILDILTNFIVFENEKDSQNNVTKIVKKVAAYHQYFAVNRSVASTVRAAADAPQPEMVKEHPAQYGFASSEEQPLGDRRAGVLWHTQGSGKSLSMVFYAGKIIQVLHNPTLVVLTDRNDLDGQLFDVFSKCSDLLRQIPRQAHDRKELKEFLTVASGGVVFTTIQKFFPEHKGDAHPQLSDRKNIVVIADEAHRSQYDFIDGFARHMHDALPNASFIGFTGTPIELSDKNTRAVFGNYIDIYDIAQAVADKATVPIYYEARLAKMVLLKEVTPKIDKDFEELTEGEEMEKKEMLKSKWARLEAMVGSQKRIALIAQDVVAHFEARQASMDGKGMFVAMSRRIAVELYDEIVKLRPQWASGDINKGFIKVVMTGSASDPAQYQKHLYTKEDRELLARRMKDPKDELKFVIVRDMWLTGFDAPSMHTMYIDKPMHGHGLMQAIARVNRVYKDKPGGLVVDYLGIAQSLKEALSHYTKVGKGSPTVDKEKATAVMLEKFELLQALYHGFKYDTYFTGKASVKASVAGSAMDYILGLENGKKRYMQAVSELSQAFALAAPSDEALRIRDEVAFFQTIRAMLAKFEQQGGLGGPTEDDYDMAIKQIVSDAVASEKVINIFDAAGLKSPNIAILSDEFLEEVQNLDRKNLALEVLRKLLNDEIRTMEKKFLVKSRSFSKMLEDTIRRYQNQTIEAAQVIVELVELAKKIRSEKERGVDLKLSEEEVAFYDALCENESAVKELGDATLKKIAQELVVMLRKNTTIDWTLKESVRAKLRVYVKKLLNKYQYPPDKQEAATKTVLEQAEVLCRDWTGN